jgi:hypothetical protein
MTIEELHASVLLKIDRDNDFLRENFVPGEIDDFINDAVDEFIDEQRSLIRSYRYSEQGMEAQENLQTIITRESTSTVNPTSVLGKDGWEVDLSEFSDFDYFIGGTASLNGDVEILRHVSSSYLTDFVRGKTLNFFQRGIPVSVESSKIIGFIPRDRTSVPTEINVNYLTYPPDVKLDTQDGSSNVELQLPKHTHRDIVNIAARKAAQSLVGQQQVQPQQKE